MILMVPSLWHCHSNMSGFIYTISLGQRTQWFLHYSVSPIVMIHFEIFFFDSEHLKQQFIPCLFSDIQSAAFQNFLTKINQWGPKFCKKFNNCKLLVKRLNSSACLYYVIWYFFQIQNLIECKAWNGSINKHPISLGSK